MIFAEILPTPISGPHLHLSRRLTMRKLYLLPLLLLFSQTLLHSQDDRWTQYISSPVIDGPVHAIFADVDAIYVGGDFTTIEGVQASNIARYDRSTQTWSAFGPGTSGPVYAINRVGDSLYVGGDFLMVGPDTVNFIVACRLSDNTWHKLGRGINGFIYTMAADGDDLYIGGEFEVADLVPASNIVRWNAADKKFDSLANGLGRRTEGVWSIVIDGDSLYASGNFDKTGRTTGITVNNIARWDINAETWSALGSGLVLNSASVQEAFAMTMSLDGDHLYVGGRFDSAGGGVSANLARWTISSGTWNSVAPSTADSSTYAVRALAAIGDDLYVGVRDYPPGGSVHGESYMLRWNIVSSNWSDVGAGINDSVLAMTVDGSRLLVGGRFTHAGNRAVNGIASWDHTGMVWNPLRSYSATSVNGPINALHLQGSTLYVGGAFTVAGEELAINIARRSASGQWGSLGNGINGPVLAIASAGSKVYVGGVFTRAGEVNASNVAVWDTVTREWSALGAGVDGPVRAIVTNLNDVYVGGSFSEAGGAPAHSVARWDGSAWSTLGTGDEEGIRGSINAMAMMGTQVVVGGNVFQAGGLSVDYIASWSPTVKVWGTFAEGTGGPIYAMAYSGTSLYVGGAFQTAGTLTARNVARWNTNAGGAWDTCGAGVEDAVYAIAAFPGNVYIGGRFGASGGTGINYIARSAGGGNDAWEPLGSGVADAADSMVTALALDASGNTLYVGGRFQSAGGKRSVYFASWEVSRSDVPTGASNPLRLLSNPVPNPTSDGFSFTLGLTRPEHVRVSLVSSDGREISVLNDGPLSEGNHELRGTTSGLSAGIYLLVAHIGGQVRTVSVAVE